MAGVNSVCREGGRRALNRSGGKPPFLTCETATSEVSLMIERLSSWSGITQLKSARGQEGWLAVAEVTSQCESDQVLNRLRPHSAQLRFVVERKLQKRVAAVQLEFRRDVSAVVVDGAGTDK